MSTVAGRVSTGDDGLDHVLGGGLVPGSVVTLYGPPGVGKSTLATKVSVHIAQRDSVLYAIDEEFSRVAQRANRFKLFRDHPRVRKNLHCLSCMDTDGLCHSITNDRPTLCVVDSLYSITSEEVGYDRTKGGAAQVSYAIERLVQVARATRTCVLVIGHETKSGGSMAGLSQRSTHSVDSVLTMRYAELDPVRESRSNRVTEHTLLRTGKNRHGDALASALYKRGLLAMVG